jgi:hypothetical protein
VQDRTLDYDVRSITVSGTLTLAGAQVPDSASLASRGAISFTELTSGSTASFALAATGPATYSVQLFPGTYSVRLSTPANAKLNGLPPGGLTQLAAAVALGTDQTLNYDVRSVTISGTLTAGGAPIPDSPSLTSRGTLTFTDQTTSATVSTTLAPTGPATYSVQLFPGTYSILFSTPANANLKGLPPGAATVLGASVGINTSQTLDYDLTFKFFTVSGTLTLGSAQIPDSPSLTSRGTISFITAGGGAISTSLSPTGPASYSVQLSPGTYSVRLSTPANANLKGLPPGGLTQLAAGVGVNADQTLDYDVRAVAIAGTLTFAGAQIPDSPSLATRGTLTFTDQVSFGTVSTTLGPTGPASYAVQLFAGSYSILFSTPANANLKGLPPGASTFLTAGVNLETNQTLDYDVSFPQGLTVSGTLTLAGAQIPDSSSLTSRGTLSFISQGGGTVSTTIGPTGPATYTVQLPPDTYAVRFSTPANANLKGLPQGGLTQLAAAVDINANQTRDFDLQSVTVSGQLTLAGAQVPDSPSLTSRGTITFVDLVSSGSYSSSLGPTGPATYTVQLFPGSYSVSLSTPANANLKGLPPGATTILDTGCHP